MQFSFWIYNNDLLIYDYYFYWEGWLASVTITVNTTTRSRPLKICAKLIKLWVQMLILSKKRATISWKAPSVWPKPAKMSFLGSTTPTRIFLACPTSTSASVWARIFKIRARIPWCVLITNTRDIASLGRIVTSCTGWMREKTSLERADPESTGF